MVDRCAKGELPCEEARRGFRVATPLLRLGGPQNSRAESSGMLQREQVSHEGCVAAFEDSKRRDAAGRGRDVFIVTNYDSADFFREGGAGLSVLPGATWRAGRSFAHGFSVVRAKRGGRLFALSRSRTARRKAGSAGVRSKTRRVLEDATGAFPEIQRLRCHGVPSTTTSRTS